jgi:eukaryotic-like serine/threonine-protein kinase
MPHVDPLREGDPAAVGPYRLVGRLGAGTQGPVYLAQARNGVPVVVKVLREELSGDDRLARELAAARRVEPLGVAQVLDASFGGRPYVVSEYVDGPPLQRVGRQDGAELQRLATATATALAAIHQAGVVHRDLKPANVLLGPGGPRVVDFGLVGAQQAVTAAGGFHGTPAYMAPEQLAGQEAGAAADVFAWAGVIVFATTGAPPFGDGSLPSVIHRIMHEEPQLGDMPQPLRAIVQSCLAKEPAHRPAMRQVMLHLLGGEQPALPQRDRARRGRRGLRTALVAGVSGVAVLSLAGLIVWLTPSEAEPNRALGAAPASPKPSGRPSVKQTPRADEVKILYVRARGTRTAVSGACQVGDTLVSGMVEGTRRPMRLSYSWIVDGQVVARRTAYLGQSLTRRLPAPPALTTPGRHTVTLRISSPAVARKSTVVNVCPLGTE